MITALTKLVRLGAEIRRTWPVQPVRRPVEWLCAPPGSEDWRLLNTTEQFDQMRFRELLTNRVCLEIDGHRLHLNEGLPLRALPLPPKAAPSADGESLSRRDTRSLAFRKDVYALSSDTIAGLSIIADLLWLFLRIVDTYVHNILSSSSDNVRHLSRLYEPQSDHITTCSFSTRLSFASRRRIDETRCRCCAMLVRWRLAATCKPATSSASCKRLSSISRPRS